MDKINQKTAADKTPHKKGVKRRLFGGVLLCLGFLNTALLLKAGFPQDPFNYLLLGSGALVFASGAISSRK